MGCRGELIGPESWLAWVRRLAKQNPNDIDSLREKGQGQGGWLVGHRLRREFLVGQLLSS
jgi:hypothetical protein